LAFTQVRSTSTALAPTFDVDNVLVVAAVGNQAPAFTVDPISKANGFADAAYSGSIASDASDPDADAMTFSKTFGPAWLSVASNGALSGTPAAGDVGANVFTVQVDATGGSDTATLNITVDVQATLLFYEEDFSTDPGYVGNDPTSIGAAGGAGTYFTFGQYNGTPEIGVTTDTGVLHIDSNTSGGSARSRGLSVFIDTSAALAGTYTVSFDVSNWVDGTGTAGFKVLEGSGLDTGYLNIDNGDNNTAGGVPKRVNTSTAPAFNEIGNTWGAGTKGSGITGNGTVSFDVELTEAGVAGDYLALAWVQVRSTDTALAPKFDVDNVWVGVPDVVVTYSSWALSHNLTGADADGKADVEYGGLGDGLENLMEYALGGNPNYDDAAAVSPDTFMADAGGTNWFYHVHNQNTDTDLTFTVGATTNLVTTAADTNDVEWVGATAETNGFKTVTNRTEAATAAKFIKLEVSK